MSAAAATQKKSTTDSSSPLRSAYNSAGYNAMTPQATITAAGPR